MTVQEEIEFHKDEAERYRKMAGEFQKEEERFQWGLTITIGIIAVVLWAIMFIFNPEKPFKRLPGGDPGIIWIPRIERLFIMPKEKITIDDIGFLIDRLVTALEQFSEQVKKADLSDPSLKIRKDTASDLKIRQYYKDISYFSFINEKDREKYRNPTPTEFLELKREHRKQAKESEREKADKIASELSALKQISIETPVTITPFNEADIIEGQIIVTGYHENYEGTVGLIGEIDADNIFPLRVFVCKQDFTSGKRFYKIEVSELVLAIIDPKNISYFLTTHLIRLAVKHSTYFKGLIYLKTL